MSREVLSPPLIHMGPNRCYRVNVVHEDFGGQQRQQVEKPQQGYVEQDLYAEDDDEDDLANCLIDEQANGLFKLTMHMASSFYGGIIGFKGTTKRRIEGETHTEIFIPRNHIGGGGKKDENIIIKGQSRSNVCSARRKIVLIVNSLRKRMPVTHFVGVPLNFGDVRANFVKFKNQILEAQLPGINENLFQVEEKLHITLTVCVLLDDAERTKAIELLQSCREFLKDLQTPFALKIKGLEIMNDDPSSVRIMYARVEAPDLQKFADRCLETFLRSNLAKEESRKTVKLHVTVLNARYSKEIDNNAPNSFDGRQILKQYGDFDFGTALCNNIRLSIRGAYVENGDDKGFYKTSSSVTF